MFNMIIKITFWNITEKQTKSDERILDKLNILYKKPFPHYTYFKTNEGKNKSKNAVLDTYLCFIAQMSSFGVLQSMA